jgi:hypothetical protein
MSSKITAQLKILETLYRRGEGNETIENTLDKIIRQELAIAQQKNSELETDLQQFEQQYQISSAEFYQRFHAGELGDDTDFVEWNAFYEMWQALQEQIKLLQSTEN